MELTKDGANIFFVGKINTFDYVEGILERGKISNHVGNTPVEFVNIDVLQNSKFNVKVGC